MRITDVQVTCQPIFGPAESGHNESRAVEKGRPAGENTMQPQRGRMIVIQGRLVHSSAPTER